MGGKSFGDGVAKRRAIPAFGLARASQPVEIL